MKVESLVAFSLLILCVNLCTSSSYLPRTKRVKGVKRTKRIGTSEEEKTLLDGGLDDVKIDLLKLMKSESSTKFVKQLIDKLIKRIDEKQPNGKSTTTTATTTKEAISLTKTINPTPKIKATGKTETFKTSPALTKQNTATAVVLKKLIKKSVLVTDSASSFKDLSNRSSRVSTRTGNNNIKREPLSIIPELIKHPPEKIDKASKPASNDINNFHTSLYGFCRAQKLRQTFTAKGCENVTIETVVCGGVCQDALQTFYDIGGIESAFETCKYCGPLEYEEKLIFMQCYKGVEKRRRWELTVRKMYVPKTCGCIKESCHKLNKVTAEGIQRFAQHRRHLK